MKFLVCIAKTPDTTARISFKDNNTQFDSDGVQYIMNPYDEWYALVRALEIKESIGGSVTVINVGLSDSDTIIRKALAIGADDAIRIDKAPADSRDVATQIAAVCRENNYDIIFTGKETIDYNGSELGAMLAEILDQHFISYATNLEVSDDQATITREIEGGSEVVSLKTPFVLSASKGLADQRIPNMRGIMMAKRKPLDVREATESSTLQQVVSYQKPEERTSCEFIDPDDLDTLVKKLQEEAKVL